MVSYQQVGRTFSGLFLVGVSILLFQNCAQSKHTLVEPASQSEVLTADLVSKSLDKGSSESELLDVAEKRQKQLLLTLKNNPAEVLRLGLSEENRELLSDSVKSYVEKNSQVEGELSIVAVDDHKGNGRIEYSLVKKSGERFTLHLSRRSAKELKTGQKIRASGLELVENDPADGSEKKHLVVDPQNSGILLLASANGPSYGTTPGKLANSYGEQKTLVIRINFSNNTTQPLSLAGAQSAMTQANTYYKEVSYNKAWLTWTVTNYFTIPATSAVCDTNLFTQQATAAALSAGFNVNNYDRVLIAFPVLSNCGWAGLGTVGGAPSYAWFNGAFDKTTVIHELGHNLGLYHAHGLHCAGTVIGGTCEVNEYGNPVDSMGITGVVGHFHAYSKDRLGWLEPGLITVTNSGTFDLAPYEYTNTKPLALKILKGINPATGEKSWYYLEYRQATGQDLNALRISGRVTDNTKGVIFHMGDELSGDNNFILDMTPTTYFNLNDAALGVAKTYSDAAAGVSFVTQSYSSTGAVVNVTLAPAACTKNAPEVTTISSGFGLVDFGSKILVKLKVMNKNSATCGNETINLSAVLPNGFSAQFDQTTLTLASGQSQEMNLVLTTPSSGTNSTYSPLIEARVDSLVGSLEVPIGLFDMSGAPPIATNDVGTTAPGQPVVLTSGFLVANDTEPDGNAVTVDNRIGVAQNGTVTVNAPQGIVLDLTYTPNPGFVGTDRFKYMVRDSTGYDVAEAVITVATPTPPTNPPTNPNPPTGDVTPPTVQLTAPANGATSRERAILIMEASATDNVKVARVEFYINGVLTCTDVTPSYRCQTSLPAGVGVTYTLEARAIDSSNNKTSHTISITSTSLSAR